MTGRLSQLAASARDILRAEGFVTLLQRGFQYALLQVPFFRYGSYYLYEIQTSELNEADFLPRIQNFTFRTICSNAEADELAAATGYYFRQRFGKARERLDRGAIATCIFIYGEIAHIAWVALNEEAKEAISPLRQRVNFSRGEAYTGRGMTMTKYRGKGLLVYGSFKRLQLVRDKGVSVLRYNVDSSNTVAQKGLSVFNPLLYARAKYIRILRWKYWRETPFTPSSDCLGENARR